MPNQPRLLSESPSEHTLTPEEEALRASYRAHLRAALQDPAFRQTPGFPLGEDEAILALSDPPYYTACPNPFLAEIIEQWQKERRDLRLEMGLPDDSGEYSVSSAQSTDHQLTDHQSPLYHREPFAADVSEGKNNPIYNAHSYHTKVPHSAIMRYILHYTDPGDLVFDGFCGTGMTGVAAQLCADKAEVEKLGYYVDAEGYIYEHPPKSQVSESAAQQSPILRQRSGQVSNLQSPVHQSTDQPISRLGPRKAILNDLSPAATFIAYNYNTPVDAAAFEREAKRILQEVEQECGWMYETWHPHCDDPNRVKARINYTVWSDVFLCPQCGNEMAFWDVAVDHLRSKVRDEWLCIRCAALLSKTSRKESGAQKVERATETLFDHALMKPVRQAKQIPVLINYSLGKNRFEKRPDTGDLALIQEINKVDILHPFPTNLLPDGFNTRQPKESHGFTHVHHFYSWRNLWALATTISKVKEYSGPIQKWLLFTFEQTIMGMSKWARYVPTHYSQVNQGLSGTLYIGSQIVEVTPAYIIKNKIDRLVNTIRILNTTHRNSVISTQSSSKQQPTEELLDYIFIDPPFGANLMYSELNFLWEAWLGVFTNNKAEAIVNDVQRKGLPEYNALMEACFHEFYRLLKPGRWMTVEFHNSQNAVWNGIQEAILRAGFMVADVRTLDKQQGTFKQITSSASVKQDLVISAYKPNDGLEERFRLQMGSADGAWAFIRYHLSQLPIAVQKAGQLEVVAERQPYLLFDRMVAFHIQRGATVPLSASEFYAGLAQRFPLRDGMHFLPEQVPAYDRARLQADSVAQLSLFVSDEKSALNWLRQQLDPALGGTPQTYQDLQPQFLRQLHQARHEQLPELGDLLEQNCLQDSVGRWYVPDPDKASDLEKLRQKALLREYSAYLAGKGRLKQFRTEAVRAGFADAYQRRDFQTLLAVAHRLPESVLQEDPDLLMYYDAAQLRAAR